MTEGSTPDADGSDDCRSMGYTCSCDSVDVNVNSRRKMIMSFNYCNQVSYYRRSEEVENDTHRLFDLQHGYLDIRSAGLREVDMRVL